MAEKKDESSGTGGSALATPTNRRGFLRLTGLSAAAVGGAAAGVAAGPEPVEAATAMPDGKDKGYRETDHVKRYYELAKFM